MCGINFEELDTATAEVEGLVEVDDCDCGRCCCCCPCNDGGVGGGVKETIVLECGISARDTSQQLQVNGSVGTAEGVRGVLAGGHMQ